RYAAPRPAGRGSSVVSSRAGEAGGITEPLMDSLVVLGSDPFPDAKRGVLLLDRLCDPLPLLGLPVRLEPVQCLGGVGGERGADIPDACPLMRARPPGPRALLGFVCQRQHRPGDRSLAPLLGGCLTGGDDALDGGV